MSREHAVRLWSRVIRVETEHRSEVILVRLFLDQEVRPSLLKCCNLSFLFDFVASLLPLVRLRLTRVEAQVFVEVNLRFLQVTSPVLRALTFSL